MSKIILYGVVFVLVTASVVMGMDVYSTYQTLQNPAGSAAPKIIKGAVEPAARKAGKKDYNVIVSRNLFASTSLRPNPPKPLTKKKIRPRVVRPPKKALPPLSVTLVGTTVGPKGVRYAILEESGSRTHVIHRMGDRVQGAVIQGVERGEIRLLRNGKVIILRAFERSSNAGSNQRASLRGRPAPNQRGGLDFRGRAAPPRPGQNTPSPPRKLTRRLNRSRLEKLAEPGAGFEKQVRVVDYRGSGGETGIRVFPTGRGRLIRMLGLRGGDVIFEIDGVPVTNRNDFQAAILNILGQNEAIMKISRRGKRYDYILSIK